jgi:hypothetical protein
MTPQPLSAPPATFVAARDAAHRLAVYVVSPARRRVTGRIGLRAGGGGFTTPPFGDDERVSLDLERLRLVTARGEAPISTVAAAAQFVLGEPPDEEWAAELDVPPLGDPDETLALDPAAAALLGTWYGFAFEALGRLRAELAHDEPNEIQLWPEHFDAAFDAAASGGRVTFGASPGDATSREPYVYVLPPGTEEHGETWNAEGFTGAVLGLSGFVDEADQVSAALAFFRGRRSAIGS